MQIGSWSSDEDVLIVAEIGNNHEGNFAVASDLVRRAAECGVGAVKFQTFRTDYYVSRGDASRYARLKSFELSFSQFEGLARLARSLGLQFVSTPLDLASAEFLEGIVDAFKIASGDNTFYPLIGRVARSGKPMIVSAGLTDIEQIAGTVAFVKEQWRAHGIAGQLAVLHCVSSYPVPPEQANLLALRALAERLDCEVGYSDHTIGVEACMIAVALGARIIEKHFTLDKHYSDFRDHQLSADPPEMSQLVRRVGQVVAMLGRPEKVVQPAEAAVAPAARRSIVAATDLPRGHRLTWRDLTWIRPAVGLAPGEEGQLVGRVLKRDLAFGEPVLPSDLEE